jgi:hypothetical protein
MRRKRLGVLLFALALAVQVIAPASASVMAEARNSSAAFAICFQAGGGPAGDRELPGPNERRSDACPLCQACCVGVAPPAAWPSSVGMAPVQWVASSWTVADRAVPTPHPDYAHRARAPPSLS